MSNDVEIHNNRQLYIRIRKLYAVQISPENLPRILNVYRDWSIRYDDPFPSEDETPTLKMRKNSKSEVLTGKVLDYIVWGLGVDPHIVPAEAFGEFYEVEESLE